MSKINLSQIENRRLMTVNDIVNYCLDNNINTVINDFGVGMEFELDDLYQVWEDIKNL